MAISLKGIRKAFEQIETLNSPKKNIFFQKKYLDFSPKSKFRFVLSFSIDCIECNLAISAPQASLSSSKLKGANCITTPCVLNCFLAQRVKSKKVELEIKKTPNCITPCALTAKPKY